MSSDLNNKNVTNLWQQSKITLDIPLSGCKCIITQQSTDNPKLIVLGGNDNKRNNTDIHREYGIREIIGDDHKFNMFMGTCYNFVVFFSLFFFKFVCLTQNHDKHGNL